MMLLSRMATQLLTCITAKGDYGDLNGIFRDLYLK